jgi:hypothetical protein
MSMRQIRLEAAHRELGSRRPYLTILGRPAALVVFVLAVAAGLYFAARALWHGVSGWLSPDEAPVSTPVSHTVSGPVSWMPWWAWAVVAALVLLVLVWTVVPRVVFRLRWGMWSAN